MRSLALWCGLSLFLSISGSFVISGVASAETLDQAYDLALKDYYAGRYEKAVEGFTRILGVPTEHEDLHYNLGCAYYRLDKLGPAIYHFERALTLAPNFEDARFNLKTSRAAMARRVKDELKGATDAPWWVRLVNMLSLQTWSILFLALWWLSLGILLLLRYLNLGPARSGLIAGNCFTGLMTLACGVLLAGRIYLGAGVPVGIVLPDGMKVREGPSSSTKVTFTLHAGHRVRLQAREKGWVRIRLPNGLEGWVPDEQVGAL